MSISSVPKTYFLSSLEYFKNLIVPLLTSQWVRASREDLVEACSDQLDPLTIVARGLLALQAVYEPGNDGSGTPSRSFTWPRQLIIDFATKLLACHAGCDNRQADSTGRLPDEAIRSPSLPPRISMD